MASSLWKWEKLSTSLKLDALIAVLNVALGDLTSKLRGVGPSFDTLVNLATKPNVSGATVWRASNSAGTLVTNFIGKPGQDIVVWATNGNTTLVHAAGVLALKGGVNVVMAATETRTFATIDGTYWRET